MKKINAISRIEEASFPDFKSHEAAINFFKEKYGEERLVFEYSDSGREQTIYFYTLILDWDVYRKGRATSSRITDENEDAMFEYLFSYQSIQIEENGSVHIVH